LLVTAILSGRTPQSRSPSSRGSREASVFLPVMQEQI
jgi:hypothetical protein